MKTVWNLSEIVATPLSGECPTRDRIEVVLERGEGDNGQTYWRAVAYGPPRNSIAFARLAAKQMDAVLARIGVWNEQATRQATSDLR